MTIHRTLFYLYDLDSQHTPSHGLSKGQHLLGTRVVILFPIACELVCELARMSFDKSVYQLNLAISRYKEYEFYDPNLTS